MNMEQSRLEERLARCSYEILESSSNRPAFQTHVRLQPSNTTSRETFEQQKKVYKQAVIEVLLATRNLRNNSNIGDKELQEAAICLITQLNMRGVFE